MQQFISATKGRRGNLKCWTGRRRGKEELNVLLLLYLLLGEMHLHGPCLSSLSDYKTRDEIEKREDTTINPTGK